MGFTAELNDILTMGLAVTDIGSITWDQETVEYSSGSEFLLTDLTDSEMMDSLTNSLQGEGHYAEEFSTSLPTAIRFGVSMQVDRFFQDSFPGELLVVMDFNQGFNDLPTNSTSPRFSMGFEWKLLSWFPLRSGISLGGRDKFNWGLGFGFDFGLIEMNMATSDMNSIVNGNGAKRIGVSLGSLWKF